MSLQFGIEKLKQDITFLSNSETNRFVDVSIDNVIQLMQRKKIYKQNFKNSAEYQDLKVRMKRLKMAKLPFRMVEWVNETWKYGKELPYALSGLMFFFGLIPRVMAFQAVTLG